MIYKIPAVVRAVASNVIAMNAPSFYVRLTGQTGRGDPVAERPGEIARYFRQCVDDYLDALGLPPERLREFLSDRVILEYGPGDFPGVALFLVAFGARKVYCVDRFAMVKVASKNLRVLDEMMAMLDGPERARLERCFRVSGRAEEGFDADRIEYLVQPSGLSGLDETVDLVMSRAVLEHVNDLDATFEDMWRAMRPGAVSIHQVDLRSHGLHVENPLDFLTVSPRMWRWMHSHKGVPNRWRADRYRMILDAMKITAEVFKPTTFYSQADVTAVRPHLDSAFRAVSDEILSWQGFWLAFNKPRTPGTA
jgi:SAM-dependent methyltransferase